MTKRYANGQTPEIRAAYMRAYYERPENVAKRKARDKVRARVESGKIIPQPCESCGCKPAQAHHEDYTKQLDIIWLCAVHHIKRHEEIDAGIPLSESRWIKTLTEA